MALKVMDLFDAYAQNQLPKDKAYIVSSFINGNTGYSIYEIISYSGVKAIYPESNGLTFQSQGKKLHILAEPASYPSKGTEPYLRNQNEQIPLRFKEIDNHICKNQIRIMMGKKPNESLSSFTITKPTGMNLSFLFYEMDDIFKTMAKFFETSFVEDAGVPQADARVVAKQIADIVSKTMSLFKAEFD